MTTILVAMTILTGAAAPAMYDYIDEAKLVRGRHDVATLGVSLVRLFSDVGAERTRHGGWATFEVLVGAGSPPASLTEETGAWVVTSDKEDVGWLDDHLISNRAAYTPYGERDRRGWRGAYIQQPVGPDPWGGRYALNVGAIMHRSADLFVLSAGPDGVVTVPFDADGLTLPGDDLVSLIASGRIGQ